MIRACFVPNSSGKLVSDILNHLKDCPEDSHTRQLFELCEHRYFDFQECADRVTNEDPGLRDSGGVPEYHKKMMACAESVQNLIARWRQLSTDGEILGLCPLAAISV